MLRNEPLVVGCGVDAELEEIACALGAFTLLTTFLFELFALEFAWVFCNTVLVLALSPASARRWGERTGLMFFRILVELA